MGVGGGKGRRIRDGRGAEGREKKEGGQGHRGGGKSLRGKA